MSLARRRPGVLDRTEGVMIGVGAIALLVCWVEHRSLGAAEDSLATSVARARQMHGDAERIELLRAAPRLATERVRPNDELIAQIEAAMRAASVAPKHWIANEPAPAVRIPRSPYQQLAIRLTFEEVSLRQIVELTHSLVDQDPSLSIVRLRLTGSSKDADDAWNAEIVVSYLVYSPQ